MKVELEIDKRYTEPEIHVCNDEADELARQLVRTVEKAVCGSVMAYSDDKAFVVYHADIIRIFAANKNVYIATKEGQYRIKERLYEMEEKLDMTSYVRISNSEIVNIHKLLKLDTSIAGTIKMYLSEGQETYVSRRYVSKIKKALGL